MLSIVLALKALRWRAAASVTVFVVALIAVTAATVGPIYLHAADQTVLSERLDQAAPSRRDISLAQSTVPGIQENSDGVSAAIWATRLRGASVAAADPRWFAPPVHAEQADVTFTANSQYLAQLGAVDGACAHLKIVAGRCVSAASTSDTIVSARIAKATGLAVGSTVTVAPTPSYGTNYRLRIVGVYEPIDAQGSFWGPWDFFPYGQAVREGPPKADTFVVSARAMSTRIDTMAQTLSAYLRLQPHRVSLDDVPAVKAHLGALNRFQAAHPPPDGVAQVTVVAPLAELLDSLSHEMSLTRTLVTVSTAQLALLALVVLYSVVAGTTQVQGPEIALAKLRGRRLFATAAQGVLPTTLLVLAATPLGALLAWLLVRLLAGPLLGGSAGVTFPPAAFAVAALAAAAGGLAALAAARRILTAPVAALLRRGGGDDGGGVGLALADAAAAALALAGLIELSVGGVLSSGHTDPLSALAPTLLAIAGAIVVLRLLPFAGRALLRATRDSRRLAAFLAVRQLVRRPRGARSMLLIAIALSLAAFAVVNWSVARTNRDDRALSAAGADTVLTVTPNPAVDLRTSVDRADPGGHAMAAAYVPNPGSTDLLAVDTRRYAGVGAWVANDAPQGLARILRELSTGAQPAITFTGDQLRLTVDLTARPGRAPVQVTVDVVDAGHEETAYEFGPIAVGSHSYTKTVGPCRSACRVTGLALSADTPQLVNSTTTLRVAATITAQSRTGDGWRDLTGFGTPKRWHGDGASVATLRAAGAGLAVDLRQSSPGGPWATLQSADIPAALPAVVSSGTAHAYPGAEIHQISSAGLDGRTLPIDGVVRAVSIPQLDRTGVLVDFGYAVAASTGVPATSTEFQVWAAAGAPKDLLARLGREGVRVTKIVRAAQLQRPLDRAGPAFAASLFLVAAVAAVVLAIGATVLAGLLGARRRGYELAALAVVGVAPRVLRRATAGEQATVLGLGLLVGLAAGVGGAVLALPSTPFFVDESVGPPRAHALPWAVIGGLVGVLVLVFLLTDLVTATLTSRQARVGRLRELP